MREGGGGVGRIGREREGGRLHPPISNPLRGDVTAAVSKGTQREQPVRIPGRSISAAGLHSQLTAHTRRTRWEREKNLAKWVSVRLYILLTRRAYLISVSLRSFKLQSLAQLSRSAKNSCATDCGWSVLCVRSLPDPVS